MTNKGALKLQIPDNTENFYSRYVMSINFTNLKFLLELRSQQTIIDDSNCIHFQKTSFLIQFIFKQAYVNFGLTRS